MTANGALDDMALYVLATFNGQPGEDAQDRWDVVRFCVAASMVTFFRIRDIARGEKPVLDDNEWSRLESYEQNWLGVGGKEWMKIQGFTEKQIIARGHDKQPAS